MRTPGPFAAAFLSLVGDSANANLSHASREGQNFLVAPIGRVVFVPPLGAFYLAKKLHRNYWVSLAGWLPVLYIVFSMLRHLSFLRSYPTGPLFVMAALAAYFAGARMLGWGLSKKTFQAKKDRP